MLVLTELAELCLAREVSLASNNMGDIYLNLRKKNSKKKEALSVLFYKIAVKSIESIQSILCCHIRDNVQNVKG